MLRSIFPVALVDAQCCSLFHLDVEFPIYLVSFHLIDLFLLLSFRLEIILIRACSFTGYDRIYLSSFSVLAYWLLNSLLILKYPVKSLAWSLSLIYLTQLTCLSFLFTVTWHWIFSCRSSSWKFDPNSRWEASYTWFW